jgi:hypothetical protein
MPLPLLASLCMQHSYPVILRAAATTARADATHAESAIYR